MRTYPALRNLRKRSLIGGGTAIAASLIAVAMAVVGPMDARANHVPVHGTILARGPFTEPVDLKVKAEIAGKLGLVQVHDSAETIVQQVTIQPGGFTGWHSHPGPAFVVVAEGTFTYYDGADESCTGIVYETGESFVDLGQGHVHSGKNEGTDPVILYVMYFDVPSGVASPFIPADDPGFCDL